MTSTAPPLRTGQSRRVVVLLALTGTAVALQQTLMLPLLPELPRLLETSPDNASWLVTATLVAGAVATPTISRLADMFGKKRMLLVALSVMVLGSVLGAFSQALPLIVAARALQGVGMAVVPVAIAIMRDVLPSDAVPFGVASMSATLAVGAGVGPPLAGVISEHLDWHAVFWATAVLGLALVALLAALVPEPPIRVSGSFDWGGALLLSVVITGILLTLSKGHHWGWTSWPTLTATGASVACLPLFLALERRVQQPIIQLGTAARPAVMVANVVSVLVGFAMFTNLLVTTQVLQLPTTVDHGQGLGVFEAGLWAVPSALVFGVTAPLSAWLSRRRGPLVALLCGTLLMSVVYVGRGIWSQELWELVLGSVLVAAGTSMAYAALPVFVMRCVPITETATANGLNMVFRTIGTSTSSATAAAIASVGAVSIGGAVLPGFGALMGLFYLAGAISLVAAVLVTTLHRLTLAEVPERSSGTAPGPGVRSVTTVPR